MVKTIGVLTGGGDCPGLNAVIRAVVYKADEYGWNVIGIRYGWKGLLTGDVTPLTKESVNHILAIGGTILKSDRKNPYKDINGEKTVMDNAKKLGIDCLIAIGGEDTLGVADKLNKAGLNCVGVPKTIDNDLSATDYTFGYQTAVQVAADTIEKNFSTAMSNDMVIICETMGRHAGWLAMDSGLAAGAHWIFIPEIKSDLDACCEMLKKRYATNDNYAVLVVSEGADIPGLDTYYDNPDKKDEFGHVQLGGIAKRLASEIQKRTGFNTDAVVIAHTQRGGSPIAYDRVLATRLGYKAIEMAYDGLFGMMASLRGETIEAVPLEDAIKPKKVDKERFSEVASFW